MDYDGGDSLGNEQYTSGHSPNQEKRICHRHAPQQIQILEAYFKECPHPDESQREHLCNILDLEVDQIKFWFQNKRTQCKARYERSSNIYLRGENEEIQREIEVMQDTFKNAICPPCGGPPFGREEREYYFQKLRLENALLKEKRDKFANFVSKNKGGLTMVDSLASAHNQQILDDRIAYGTNPNNPFEPSDLLGPPTSQTIQPQELSQMDIMQLSKMAESAVEELKRLFFTEEVRWVKSYFDETYVIDQSSYEKFPHAIKYFRNTSARVESSRDVIVVPIEATNLTEMFIDSEKWKNLFPTIVNKAKTIHVLGSELPIRENFKVLQVMWEQLHILSPLVPPREFMIVRCCQQIDEGWIVADVSHGVVNFDQTSAPCYKRPSGCIIRALPNGHSEVKWIEHVEVDDKSDTHQMYRQLLCGGWGYGARRWIITLERMCERMALSSIQTIPATDWSEGIRTMEGRRRVMKLGERMLKNLNEMLTMSGRVDFPQCSKSGVRVSTRLNIDEGQPLGLVLTAASCLSLPPPPLDVFHCLRNLHTRHQWDVLCYNNKPSEIARVYTGSNETNYVSILRPTQRDDTMDLLMSQDSNNKTSMLMLQDCYMDALGGMLVYAPIDKSTMDNAVSGQADTSTIPILPSGFIISSDGHDHGGTVLTVVYQILVTGRTITTTRRDLTEKSVDKVSGLISSTVRKIKVLLNCPDHQ